MQGTPEVIHPITKQVAPREFHLSSAPLHNRQVHRLAAIALGLHLAKEPGRGFSPPAKPLQPSNALLRYAQSDPMIPYPQSPETLEQHLCASGALQAHASEPSQKKLENMSIVWFR